MDIHIDDQDWQVVDCDADINSLDKALLATTIPERKRKYPSACGSMHKPWKNYMMESRNRETTEATVTQSDSTRCLVGRLPTEILSTIFDLAVAESPFANGGLGETRTTESIIAQVCTWWRRIALDTPALWTTIRVRERDSKEWTCWTLVFLRIQTYLKRSGQTPVDLWVEVRSHWVADWFLKNFRDHLPRWRRVSMRLPEESLRPYAPTLSALADEGAANLESLELGIPQHDKLELFAEPMEGFLRGVPKLKHVRMDTKSFRSCMPPLQALTTLHLETWCTLRPRIRWQTFCAIITSPNLRNLTLEGGKIFDNRDGTERLTATTSIERFFCDDDGVIAWMWGALDAPHLKTVIIKNFVNQIHPQIIDGKDHFPLLTSIVFIDCGVTPRCMEIIGTAARHVTDFTVIRDIWHPMGFIDMTIGLSPLESLAAHSDDQLLWPELKLVECDSDANPFLEQAQREACARLLRRHDLCYLRVFMRVTHTPDRKKKSAKAWNKMKEGERVSVVSPREADFVRHLAFADYTFCRRKFPRSVKDAKDTIGEIYWNG